MPTKRPDIESLGIAGSMAREIAISVEAAIEAGRLAPGDPLPSVRAVATHLGVSPVTVAAAFKELRSRGVVTTHERRRTHVTPRPPLALRSMLPLPGNVRDLASDNPDPEFLPDLSVALGQLKSPVHLYGETTIYPPLAELAQKQYGDLGVDAAHVAIVNGTFDGIARLLNAHLRPGDRVAMEDPGYTGVLDLLRAFGYVPVGIPIDDDGMLPGALESVLADGVEVCIVTPRSQNPTGSATGEPRAEELRAVLEAHPRVMVVEDDHAGPITDHAYHSLVPGRERWAVVRSVSKYFGPDLRLALLAGDRLTVSRVEGRQLLTSGWVSFMLQRLVVALWTDKRNATLLRHATKAYSERRNATIEALAAHGIEAHGRTGLNVWIPVQEEGSAMRNLLQLGWAVTAGEIFRLSTAPALRVTTAALPLDQVEALADDVARALAPGRRTFRS